MTRKQLIRLWAVALNIAIAHAQDGAPNSTVPPPEDRILGNIEGHVGYSMSASQRKDVLETARRMREE